MNFFKDYITYIINVFVPAILGLILLPIFLSTISLEEYGVITLLLMFASIASLCMSGQLHSSFWKFVPEKDNAKDLNMYVSSILIVISTLSLIFVFIFWVLQDYISQFLEIDDYNAAFLLPVFIAYAVLSTFQQALTTLSQMQKKSSAILLATLVQSGGLFLLSIAGWALQILTLDYIAVSYLVSMGLCVVTLLIPNRHSVFPLSFSLDAIKEPVKFGIGYIPYTASKVITRHIDKIFILKFMSLTEVSIYAVLLKLAQVFINIASSAGKAIMPIVLDKQSDLDQTRLHVKMAHFSLTLLFFVYAISGELVLNIVKAGLGEYAYIMLAICTSYLIFNVRALYQYKLIEHGRSALISKLAIATGIINIGLSFICIQFFGILGIALSVVLASISSLFIYIYALYQQGYDPLIKASKFSFGLVICLLLVIAGFYMSYHIYGILGLFAGGLYICAYKSLTISIYKKAASFLSINS